MISLKQALIFTLFLLCKNFVLSAQSPQQFLQINIFEKSDFETTQNPTPFASEGRTGDYRVIEKIGTGILLSRVIRNKTMFKFGLGYSHHKQNYGSGLFLPTLAGVLGREDKLTANDANIGLREIVYRNHYLFVPVGLDYNFLEDKRKSRLFFHIELRPHLLLNSKISPEYWVNSSSGIGQGSSSFEGVLINHFKSFTSRMLFATKVGLGFSLSIRQGYLPKRIDYGCEISWVSLYGSPNKGLTTTGGGIMYSLFVRFARK